MEDLDFGLSNLPSVTASGGDLWASKELKNIPFESKVLLLNILRNIENRLCGRCKPLWCKVQFIVLLRSEWWQLLFGRRRCYLVLWLVKPNHVEFALPLSGRSSCTGRFGPSMG